MGKPTKELIAATKTVLLAKAYTETIRPEIEAIQKKHLDIMRPVDRYDGKPITNIKYAWGMPDDDFQIYYRSCQEDYRKAGFKFGPDECPLLIAEELERQALRLMVKESSCIVPDFDTDLLYVNMKQLHKYEELTIKAVLAFAPKEFRSFSI